MFENASVAQFVLSHRLCMLAKAKFKTSGLLFAQTTVVFVLDQVLIRCNLMMMLPAFQFACFAVFIASFSCVKAEVLSQSQYNGINPLKDGFSNHTGCVYSCNVVISDFLKGRKTVFVKGTLIKLHFKNNIVVDEKCLKQTSPSSSGNGIIYFEVWQPEDTAKIFTFEQAMQVSSNILFFPDFGLHIDVKEVCSLLPFGTRSVAADSTPHSDNSFELTVFRYLGDYGLEVRSLTANKRNGWVRFSISCLWVVFPAAFFLYSPAFICLFSPTVLRENGHRQQIVLEGSSPVSLRSFVGNFFYSGSDTIWHKARRLIFPFVVLPLPFLSLATIFQVYVIPYVRLTGFSAVFYGRSHPLLAISFPCYGAVLAFYDFFTFKISQPVEKKRCVVCDIVHSANFTPHDGELPQLIWWHLRVLPLIWIKYWNLFHEYLVTYF